MFVSLIVAYDTTAQCINCFAVMILEILFAVAIATVGYILVGYFIHLMRLKEYPPGPWPLPIIGNWHLIGSQPHKAFDKLAKKYGPVMSFSFGTQRMVVVQGIKEAKEILVTKGQSFAGRGCLFYTLQRNMSCNMFCTFKCNMSWNTFYTFKCNMSCNTFYTLQRNMSCNTFSTFKCNMSCNTFYTLQRNMSCNMFCTFKCNMSCKAVLHFLFVTLIFYM